MSRDCGEARGYRHLAEFDFGDNRRGALKISDTERAEDLLWIARDKRLIYRRIGEARYAYAEAAKVTLRSSRDGK